jgi:HlyD family secretion protein
MKKIPWSRLVVVALFGLMVTAIVRTIMAGPQNVPQAKDVQTAAREVKPKNGVDEKVVLPQGNYVSGNGIVEPAQPETKVAGPLAGRVVTILVKEGDHVEKGAPLVTMENFVETAALAAAEADLATAKATFERVSHGQRAEDVIAANADAEAAKAKATSSAEILARIEKLAAAGAATPDELDRAKNTAAADAANAKAIAARAKATTLGSRYEDVAEAKARVVAAQARRDQAQAMLDRLTIRAPITGEVLRVKYRDGEYYNPNGTEPLLILGDTTKLRVRMDVDERDVGRLKTAAGGLAMADAFPGRKFPGKVVEISRRMGRKNIRTDDPVERIDTKILEVVIELDDNQSLVPGQRVVAYVDAGS